MMGKFLIKLRQLFQHKNKKILPTTDLEKLKAMGVIK